MFPLFQSLSNSLFFSNFLFFATLRGSEVVWRVNRRDMKQAGEKESEKATPPKNKTKNTKTKQNSEWIIGFRINLYFFIRKWFLFSGEITWARRGNHVSWLGGCKIQKIVSMGLFSLAKVSALGILLQIQRPKSEAYRGELLFQDSRCVCETTRYGANWFHPWETGDFSKLCLLSQLMQFPISALKCALINSNIKATK